MTQAATWIAPDGEIDRGNLLGAAIVTSQRNDRELVDVVEGAEHADEALAAARRTGMLIVPCTEQVVENQGHAVKLLRCAQDEGWRLLLLDAGADSAAPSGEQWLRFVERLAVTRASEFDGPVPSAALRHRVAVGGELGFRLSGLLHVDCFDKALAATGVRLAEVDRLLEWGAGSGRMTAHLPAFAPRAQITAVDTDTEAIAWVADNLPVQSATSIPLLPPTAFDDDAFELVIGHSVFSHLAVQSQDAWLAELARVTRPGGHVAVSFNGQAALDWHVGHPLVELPDAVEGAYERHGIGIWVGDGWENEFYDGYHTTFHQHAYVREHWGRWFEVVEIHPAAALPIQDIVVLRARRTGSSRFSADHR